jgi:hypothetical protein
MSDFLVIRSVSALQARYGVTDSTLSPAAPREPAPRAGEILLTPSQKVALLTMRRSDWSEAVLAHLKAFGRDAVSGGDYRALARLSLAVNKGSFHVLTPPGRWRADLVAMELARENDLHVIAMEPNPRYGAAYAKCTCGWRVFRSRVNASYAALLARDARSHLEHEGALP